MPVEDIRILKARLRERYRSFRTNMDPLVKAEHDRRIADIVRSMWQYRHCRQVLVYVSTPIEVDTHAFITQALQDGKRVAVPRCIPETRNMDFYYIRSLEDLSPGTFGVMEPRPDPDNLVTDLSHGLCLIPAFSYDYAGFRLGYGKGYYDRFLARFNGVRVGICYAKCICYRLPHGRFDRPAQLLVTENYIRRTAAIRREKHVRSKTGFRSRPYSK